MYHYKIIDIIMSFIAGLLISSNIAVIGNEAHALIGVVTLIFCLIPWKN